MNKSYRIRTKVNPDESKNIKIKLDQEVDKFNILSLTIDQTNDYQDFNCNHGVLVGRVIANGGVGIPNAKVSIFIPITDEDAIDPNILAVYPYKTPRDKNEDGKRYNLLPRVATQNPETGLFSPAQPFGSFPIKEEFITNPTLLDVYKKYYKYSTVTNQSGDYMIFGAPVGVQTVHMSIDITDIGRFSMTPSTLVNNLGFSPNLFTENGTRIKPSEDLDDLPNIETQEISVDIIPFCGDNENFDVGITRQDFRIRAELVNTFILFGTTMTPPRDGYWNDLDASDSSGDDFKDLNKYAGKGAALYERNVPTSFRTGEMDERILYLHPNISDDDAETYNFDPINDLVILPKDGYVRNTDQSGNFFYQIQCNRKKIVTNEIGEDVIVANDSNVGVFTEFRGLMLAEMSFEELDRKEDITQDFATFEKIRRSKFRVPQAYDNNIYKDFSTSTSDERNPVEYLGKHKVFKANGLYSVSQFIAVESTSKDEEQLINDPDHNRFVDQIVGSITLDDSTNSDVSAGMLSNGTGKNDLKIFAGEWLNFCIFFHQWATIQDEGSGSTQDFLTPSLFIQNPHQSKDARRYLDPLTNQEPIGAGLINSQGYVNAGKIYTDWFEIKKEDLISIRDDINDRGFRFSDITSPSSTKKQTNIFVGTPSVSIQNDQRLDDNYRDSDIEDIGFNFNDFNVPSQSTDPYFFTGVGDTNLINFLNRFNILS